MTSEEQHELSFAPPKDDQIVLKHISLGRWVNPFGATAEEFIANTLDDNGLIDPETLINDMSARQLSQQFLSKRASFQEATRLGNMLLAVGVINEEQLAQCLDKQHKSHQPLGQLLVDAGYCTQQQMLEILNQQSTVREHYEELAEAESRVKHVWDKLRAFMTFD
ncbi:MAG: hypothetical protein K2X01_02560 [Cyanobacteria bacterium]|nr:hypothetical protein [Cyanobacteriota bacterium]